MTWSLLFYLAFFFLLSERLNARRLCNYWLCCVTSITPCISPSCSSISSQANKVLNDAGGTCTHLRATGCFSPSSAVQRGSPLRSQWLLCEVGERREQPFVAGGMRSTQLRFAQSRNAILGTMAAGARRKEQAGLRGGVDAGER